MVCEFCKNLGVIWDLQDERWKVFYHTTGHLRDWSYSFRRQGGCDCQKCLVVWFFIIIH